MTNRSKKVSATHDMGNFWKRQAGAPRKIIFIDHMTPLETWKYALKKNAHKVTYVCGIDKERSQEN